MNTAQCARLLVPLLIGAVVAAAQAADRSGDVLAYKAGEIPDPARWSRKFSAVRRLSAVCGRAA
ncbi:MAG TPA: hypothetical protein VFR86_24330 [Burkholderiaceae bacterium]|nr:hypothetical protein [Burkholderiaceae bacterium]